MPFFSQWGTRAAGKTLHTTDNKNRKFGVSETKETGLAKVQLELQLGFKLLLQAKVIFK